MNRTLVIAISILLAFCAGIYFWTEWQKKEFDASLPEPPAPVQVQAAETNDGHTGGHWHGDEWHAEPHADMKHVAQQTSPKRDSHQPRRKLSQEQIDALNLSFYGSLGLDVPPKGHHYVWEAPEVVMRDENGNPIMLRDDEPYIEITTVIGFAPTRAEWDRYQELLRAQDLAFVNDDDAESQRLRDEIEQFRAEVQGEIPSVSGSWAVSADEDVEAFNREMNRKVDERMRQAYRDYGLGHMVDFPEAW